MSTRFDNLRYFIDLSFQIKRGIAYFDSWHSRHDSHGRRGRARYKNIDRATIRKAQP